MGRHRALDQPRLRLGFRVAAAGAVCVALLLAMIPGATAESGLSGLEVARIEQQNCQIALARATTSAVRMWARDCVAAQQLVIDAYLSSPSPTPSPTVTTTTPAPSPSPSTPATGCMPVPSACGWPDETNTGVPAGTALTLFTGDYHAARGEIIDGLDIRGCLYVDGMDVTVRNSRIGDSDCWYAARNFSPTYSGLRIVDSEIRVSALGGSYGVSYSNYTLNRVRFTNPWGAGGDCAYFGSNVVIEDTFCNMPTYPGDPDAAGAPHFDGFSSSGGSGVVLRHNTIRVPVKQTAAILLSSNDGPIGDVSIVDNLLAGGGYTVYCGATDAGAVPGLTFTGNRIARTIFPNGGYWGPNYRLFCPASGWTWD